MTQPQIEALDIDSITWRRNSSTESRAVRAMQPGQALAISHEGYKPEQCHKSTKGRPNWCSLVAKLRSASKARTDVRFSFAHLPDGRLGVACFAKEDKP